MRLQHYIVNYNINEAAYDANLGFEELVKFYQMASKIEIEQMEKIIKTSSWKEFKQLIQKVIGTRLK